MVETVMISGLPGFVVSPTSHQAGPGSPWPGWFFPACFARGEVVGVLSNLRTSGSLPVNELNLMTPGSPRDLLGELVALKKGGLVEFDGELPEADALPEAAVQIRLTRAGLKQSLA